MGGVATAAMFGAEPMPASFEKRPRFTPFSIAAMMPPVTPPAASCRPKAWAKIEAMTPGTSERFMISTTTAIRR
jgi:hypothetical protein